MEAKDLRIGNLITYKSAADTNEIMKVSVGCLYRIDEDSSGYDPIIIDKIQLTLFGFEELTETFLMFNKDGVSFDFYYTRSGSAWVFELNGDSFNIKYIHQLQNLYFAITGEELEYKNECSTVS